MHRSGRERSLNRAYTIVSRADSANTKSDQAYISASHLAAGAPVSDPPNLVHLMSTVSTRTLNSGALKLLREKIQDSQVAAVYAQTLSL